MGGTSREREISFAGGRTVYDNLNKSLFDAIPIFIDSIGNWIELDWQFVYKGTIRDFYPPVDFLPPSPHQFQIYAESLDGLTPAEWDALISRVGKRIQLHELAQRIDFAFLTLHGQGGEDGQIQGLLETLRIPYTGSGIRASCIGMDKAFQKKLMEKGGFAVPNVATISRQDFLNQTIDIQLLTQQNIGSYPIVVRPANQGSSIGVQIVREADQLATAVRRAFFIEKIEKRDWVGFSTVEKTQFLRTLTDIRTGIGFPLWATHAPQQAIYHPEALWALLDTFFANDVNTSVELQGYHSEQTVVIEEFIDGKEFSCVVIRGLDNELIALPPTEIVKGKEVFDYRSKYLAGLSRKLTPINLPNPQIEAIRHECENLFRFFEFNVYARIDGFIRTDGTIFLNDPNTTSGMLPSSFFFHQAAEIGLNPSQFLTYIIYISIKERVETTPLLRVYDGLLRKLDESLAAARQTAIQKKRIAVFLGGYSSERHISVESGRNIYEKLASSTKYEPIPVFVSQDATAGHRLHQIPVNLLLKDNADDILDKINHYTQHTVIEHIKTLASGITQKFASSNVIFAPQALQYSDLAQTIDGVFIALHGRPGEDGDVQARLQALGVPFNGSVSHSAQITINKYETLQTLKKHGFVVTDQYLAFKNAYLADKEAILNEIEAKFSYPLIAKPVDDGCSSAVKVLKNRVQLDTFLALLFREEEMLAPELAAVLNLKPKEEFPQKSVALIETLIQKGDAIHFLEITGGLLTHRLADGTVEYEMFEPSETLASGEILSLEEKFLAGEGQNLTPARYVPAGAAFSHATVSAQVRDTLRKAAEVLGVTGYARIDAFVRVFADGRAETIVVEVNSLPGMTPATCIFHQCGLNGYKPFEFIDRILEFGFGRALANA